MVVKKKSCRIMEEEVWVSVTERDMGKGSAKKDLKYRDVINGFLPYLNLYQ